MAVQTKGLHLTMQKNLGPFATQQGALTLLGRIQQDSNELFITDKVI